jgi:hypothetical protein
MPDFSNRPEAFVSQPAIASAVSRAAKLGKLRKIAPRLYTRNLSDSPEKIVQRNLWPLIAAYLPGALIADRTALENRPSADGSVFLVASRKREISWPGVKLRPRKGLPALGSDLPFIGGLHIASPARALLENMRHSRARKGVARTVSKREIEERLDEILRQSGEPALQRLRDNARQIAGPLGMQDEFQRLDRLIGALFGTRKAQLESPVAIARAAGRPYDPLRLDLFQRLFAELAGTAPVTRLARPTDSPVLAFFEAYFSNFIEGTEFAIDEAADIVFNGYIPQTRPADAHDILGTWKVVSDERGMSRLPRNFAGFLELLTERHAAIMEGRPEKNPGRFKTEPNRAGSTFFVSPELVEGTLAKGFEIYRGISCPLHRAIFMMFLVSEVHPFADGNGRVARVMMNAELVAAGENRIIVPVIYRNNYMIALKALSQNGITGALIRMMDYAQRYTAAVDFADLSRARLILGRTHAFTDSNEADSNGIRLTIPPPGTLVIP